MSGHLIIIRDILSEITKILNRNPQLLHDKEVKELIIIVYGIAMIYGDSRVKKFFKTIRPKLF